MALAVAAFACTPEEEAKVTPEVKLNSEAAVTVPVGGEEVTVTFTSNVAWTAALKEAAEWCVVATTSGEAGEGAVKLMVDSNTTNDNRVAVLVITAETATAEVTITQLQKDALVLNGTKKFEIPAAGGTVEFEVSANIAVTVTSDSDFVTETPAAKGMETVNHSWTVAPNTSLEARPAKLTVKGGEFTEEIVIEQAGFVPEFAWATEDALDFTGEGGTATVTVTANCEYTFVADEGVEWLTIADNEDGTYTLTVASGYDDPSNRACNVWLTIGYDAEGAEEGGPDGTNDYKYFEVSQKGTATTVWSKNVPVDYTAITLGMSSRLAYSNGALLLATGTGVHAINPADGAYVQAATLPAGIFTTGEMTMASDNAGNVLIADIVDFANPLEDATEETPAVYADFVLYKTSSLTGTPEEFGRYNVGNIYGAHLGHIRINGNLDEDAVIVAFCGTTNYAVAWEVVAGEVKEPYAFPLPQRDIWNCRDGFVMPLGTKLSDGLYYNGYGSSYAYAYCADPTAVDYDIEDSTPDTGANEDLTAAIAAAWTDVYPAITTWELTPCAASLVEMGGKKYMACLEATYFPYWAIGTAFYVLDVTDPTAPTRFYTGHRLYNGQDLSGAKYAGDILMQAGDNALILYATDNAQGIVEKINVPVK